MVETEHQRCFFKFSHTGEFQEHYTLLSEWHDYMHLKISELHITSFCKKDKDKG
jgi:hypothetical protein